MRINTNIMALNAQNKLTVNQSGVEKSIQKLSSGLRINGAADDAAGLAISEKMRSQIRGLNQAESNAQDGISLLQTAEGALQQTTDILQRMRELVIKAQNTGVLTEEDKTSISTELSTLRDEIDRISVSTTFNGKKLLNGDLATEVGTTNELSSIANSIDVSNAKENATFEFTTEVKDGVTKIKVTSDGKTCYGDKALSNDSISGKVSFAEFGISVDFKDKTAKDDIDGDLTTANVKNRADFKIGANTFTEDVLSVGIGDMSAKGLNKMGPSEKFSIDISDAKASDATLKAIDFAIDKVSSQRATIGTVQNRMEYAISNLSTTSENLSAAESRIRDVDMAEEMVNYTKSSILNQSAMAMLAQANQQPQIILSLLG